MPLPLHTLQKPEHPRSSPVASLHFWWRQYLFLHVYIHAESSHGAGGMMIRGFRSRGSVNTVWACDTLLKADISSVDLSFRTGNHKLLVYCIWIWSTSKRGTAERPRACTEVGPRPAPYVSARTRRNKDQSLLLLPACLCRPCRHMDLVHHHGFCLMLHRRPFLRFGVRMHSPQWYLESWPERALQWYSRPPYCNLHVGGSEHCDRYLDLGFRNPADL